MHGRTGEQLRRCADLAWSCHDSYCHLKVSIIIPVLNEAQYISETLAPLQQLRTAGHEVIIVDGGSHDATLDVSRSYADHVLISRPGRAFQMNAGSDVASGNVLLFLHADTRLPENVINTIENVLSGHEADQAFWGRFNVRLSGSARAFRVIERMINIRSCLTSVATGDQAIFISRGLFDRVHGYPEIPLMEDVAISKRLRKYTRSRCLSETVVTSSRRWEQSGVLATVLLMWKLRLYYFFGVSPETLARMYRR
jgi:rSAM/selenodomain-associated transferase 2